MLQDAALVAIESQREMSFIAEVARKNKGRPSEVFPDKQIQVRECYLPQSRVDSSLTQVHH